MIALLLALSGVEGPLATQAVDFTERTLATIPEGAKFAGAVFADDGSAVACGHRVGDQGRVTCGSWTGPLGEAARPLAVTRGGRQILHTNGMKLLLNDRLIQTFGATPDVSWHHLGVLSADGGAVVFSVRHAKEEWCAYSINGTLGKRHKVESLGFPLLTADGKTLVGSGRANSGEFILVNDVPGPSYESVIGPALSANGVIAYVAEKTDGTAVLHHGDRISVFKEADPLGLFISPDGAKLGFVKAGDGKRFVQVGERKYPGFRAIVDPRFDASGVHVAYRALDGSDKWFIVVDDQVVEAPELLSDPAFSADGRKVGYGVRAGADLRWKVLEVSK
jgi:hypothetical protein